MTGPTPYELSGYIAGRVRGKDICARYGITPARLFVLVLGEIKQRESAE